MKRRNRKRTRVVCLAPSQFEQLLAASSPVGRVASIAGMTLVSVRAYACDDGTYTLREVWRDRRGPVQTSMSGTTRGLRLPT